MWPGLGRSAGGKQSMSGLPYAYCGILYYKKTLTNSEPLCQIFFGIDRIEGENLLPQLLLQLALQYLAGRVLGELVGN